MSKYTKIIAALGVAAGLGVASLPAAGVFADSNSNSIGYNSNPAAGTVEIEVTIDEVLELKLTQTDNVAVSAQGTGNGIVATVLGTNDFKNNMSTVANVRTNHAEGYTLFVTDSDNDTDLAHTDAGSHTGAAHTQYIIPANAGAAIGTSGWYLSYKIATINESRVRTDAADDTKTAVSAYSDTAGATLMTSESATTNAGDEITVTYNVGTANDQAAGKYTGAVTYRAVANPAASEDAPY